MGKLYLVTGGAGFIGSNLAETLENGETGCGFSTTFPPVAGRT